MADLFENTDTSTSGGQEVRKFGDGFDTDTKLTAKKVAEEAIPVFDYYSRKLEKFEPEISHLADKVTDQEKELKIARTDNSKSLAVFVALFTFVSISFSILPRISHPLVLLGILLVLLGSLTLFVLLLAWILDVQRDKWFTRKQIIVGVLIFFLLVGGLVSAYFGYQDMKNNNFYTQKEVDSLLDMQEEMLGIKVQESEEYANAIISRFKVCVATRGLSACLVE